MAITKEHELHKRRRSRNWGLGLVLMAFGAIVFGMTIVKVGSSDFGRNTSAPESAVQTDTGQITNTGDGNGN